MRFRLQFLRGSMRFLLGACSGLALMSLPSVVKSGPTSIESEYWIYVGTAVYGAEQKRKIYLCHFDPRAGHLELLGAVAETPNPGFLATDPAQRFLYAVNEVGEFQGKKNGAVSSFRIDPHSGRLVFLNQVAAYGANPSYITISGNGRFAVVASYYGGIASFPIGVDGSLDAAAAEVKETGSGLNKIRQESSHPHSVVLSPDNRFAISVDLGLDKLFAYGFDDLTGSLSRNDSAFVQANPGSGPRHLAFSSDSRFAYVINELASSLSVYAYDAKSGSFRLVQTTSTLPADFKGENTGAEVQVSASGRFVYTSNRGHDSIAVFAADTADGSVRNVQLISARGKTPRNFVLDPTGSFLLVGDQDSDKIVVFHVDKDTGRLSATGEGVTVPSPACLSLVAVR